MTRRGGAEHARHPRAPRNRDPDVGWKLRPDVVKSEGRDQAHHRARDSSGGNHQVVVFGGSRAGRQPVSSRSDLFEGTGPRHSGQRARVNALTRGVTGPQDRLVLRQAENLAGAVLTLRRFAYTHIYL